MNRFAFLKLEQRRRSIASDRKHISVKIIFHNPMCRFGNSKIFSNLCLSAKQFRTSFKTINWKTCSFWNLFLHFFLPRTCSSVTLTFRENILKCLILLLFYYFCFLLCLTSLKSSRCAGKKIIYDASTAPGKIKPAQIEGLFFHPTTCNRMNILSRKMHFSSRSRGHLTLIWL